MERRIRTIYCPSIIDGLANVNFRCLKEGNRFGLFKNKYDPSWYTDKAIFTHEHALTSYFISKRFGNFRTTQRMSDDTILWADSGGYTVATKGVKIDPAEALQWQEENANIAFTLDIPPTIVTAGTQISPGKNERVSKERFIECAKITRANNLYFLKNRKRKDLLIYNVQHGWDSDTHDLWWDYTAKDIPFEGYATGIKPAGDCLIQAMCLMLLWKRGVRERVHLLGVSGITVIPVLVWASQYIDKISFDSKSYGYGSITRAYVYPDRIRYYTHLGKKKNTKKDQIDKFTCTCPVCSMFEDTSYFEGGGNTWPGMLLSLHNLWCVKKYVEELDFVLNEQKDKNKFFELVRKHTGDWADKTNYAINFIEDVIKYGFERAYNMYFISHTYNMPKFSQRSLV